MLEIIKNLATSFYRIVDTKSSEKYVYNQMVEGPSIPVNNFLKTNIFFDLVHFSTNIIRNLKAPNYSCLLESVHYSLKSEAIDYANDLGKSGQNREDTIVEVATKCSYNTLVNVVFGAALYGIKRELDPSSPKELLVWGVLKSGIISSASCYTANLKQYDVDFSRELSSWNLLFLAGNLYEIAVASDINDKGAEMQNWLSIHILIDQFLKLGTSLAVTKYLFGSNVDENNHSKDGMEITGKMQLEQHEEL